MPDMVMTARGEVPRAELTFRDTVVEDAKAVNTTRDWYHTANDGALVRRDAWVDLKRGESTAAQKGL